MMLIDENLVVNLFMLELLVHRSFGESLIKLLVDIIEWFSDVFNARISYL